MERYLVGNFKDTLLHKSITHIIIYVFMVQSCIWIMPPHALKSFFAPLSSAKDGGSICSGINGGSIFSDIMEGFRGAIDLFFAKRAYAASPVADAGGPYGPIEGWHPVTFDGSGSYADEGIAEYFWDFGEYTHTFDGNQIDYDYWAAPPQVIQDNEIILTGAGGWGNRYLFSKHTYQRDSVFEALIKTPGESSHQLMIGFKKDNEEYHYDHMPYNIYFSTGSIYIYEDGINRGKKASYIRGDEYEIRIGLKKDAGAIYYYRENGASDWTQLYDSNYGDTANLRIGANVHLAGAFSIDNIRVINRAYGVTPVAPIFIDKTVTLTVTDAIGQSAIDTASVSVSIVTGDPPAADPGGPYIYDESYARYGIWNIPLDGSGSEDDYEIAMYEWEYGDYTYTFDGTEMDHNLWVVSPYVTQNNEIIIEGAGGWGLRYFSTKHTYQRDSVLDASIKTPPETTQQLMIGFKKDNENYHYNEMPYAINFSSGNIYIREEGASRGRMARYTRGEEYEIRIEQKRHHGAIYYFREKGTSEWTLLYESEYSSLSGLKVSADVLTGTFSLDNLKVVSYSYGERPAIPVLKDQTLRLTVYDYAGQSSTATTSVQLVPGDIPNADSGGPYETIESGQLVAFDATGSTDDHGIIEYFWDFGEYTFSFDGKNINRAQWIAPSQVTQDNEIIIEGDGDWGHRYLFSKHNCPRGSILEASIKTPDDSLQGMMIGFKTDNEFYHYDQMPYALNFVNGQIRIYEDGSYRGVAASYTRGQEYEIRIELKKDAGAYYSFREKGSSGWIPVYNSNYSSVSSLRVGIDIQTARFIMDNIKLMRRAYSLTPNIPIFHDQAVTLTVKDNANQTDIDTRNIEVVFGDPPQAEMIARDFLDIGIEDTFNASLSKDDFGIAAYFWDFGDGTSAEGETVYHFYPSVGTYTVTLKVYDYSGQYDIETKEIQVSGENLVLCVPWQIIGGNEIPHDTWSGNEAVLKAVAKSAAVPIQYTWDFGDGTSLSGTITDPEDRFAIEARHVYTGSDGEPFVATITITDSAGITANDIYRLVIREKTLEIEENVAIDNGLWWLYKQQERGIWPAGTYGNSPLEYSRWLGYSDVYASSTASVIHAFLINGHMETGDPVEDPYVETVRRGMRYIFTILNHVNIDPQTYGDPDTNGNGIGVEVSERLPIYQGGMVIDAIAATGTPGAIAHTGGLNILGRTYRDILIDMVDMYAWGQYDDETVGGGWRYSWNQAPDNSASQWGAIGLLAAEEIFGIEIPQWIKDRNDVWLDYSYDGIGFGYRDKGHGDATTPSGMIQLAFCDKTTQDSRWRPAENWIANSWSKWLNRNNVYAFYAFSKAMRQAQPQEVVTLSATGLDWFGDESQGLARHLIDRQEPDLGWPEYYGRLFSSAWTIIILTRALFVKPPVAIIYASPNPGAIGQEIWFNASASYHLDPFRHIVDYQWDFDVSDGLDWDHPDATGPVTTHTFGQLGDYTVTLRILDDNVPPRMDTDIAVINITIPPHPPTADAGGPYMAATGEPVKLDGSSSYDINEPDGDSITAYGWETDMIAPRDFDDATGVAPSIPGFDNAGTYPIGLMVTDDTKNIFPASGSPNLTDRDFTEVVVYKQCISDLYVRPKGTKASLVWSHTGAKEYRIYRSEKGPNTGYKLIGTTASTYSTFMDYNVELYKDYWYRVLVEDIGGICASYASHIKSIGRIRNRPPQITSAPPVSAQEDQLYTYYVEASDPDGHSIDFFLDQAPDGMTIDRTTGFIEWVPHFSQVAPNDVTVRVTDSMGASSTQFFTIIVSPRPNLPPVADPDGPYSGLRDHVITFDGSGSYDPEGDLPLSFQWNFGDGKTSDDQNPTHIYTAAGSYIVTLYVTDSRGATGHAETTAQIDAPNRVPTANAGGPYGAHVQVEILFDGSGSFDPDGDSLIYTWNFGDSTPPEAGRIVTHTYTTEGTYNVSLSVDDGRGGQDTDEAEAVIAPPNLPPDAQFTGNTSGNVGEEFTFDASLSGDPDGVIISYEWDFGDGSTTTGILVTHIFNTPGDYTVSLSVTDDDGESDTQSYTLTVSEANTAPQITSIPVTEAVINIPYTYDVDATDTDGDILTYELDIAPPAMSISADTGLIEWTPGTSDIGDNEVRIIVRDPSGAFDTQEFIIGVRDPSDTSIPVVEITSPETDSELTAPTDIIGTASDENLLTYTLEYSERGKAEYTVFFKGYTEVINDILGTLDTTMLINGLYDIRLSAVDVNGLTSSVMVTYLIKGNLKVGNFTITFEDLEIPVAGIPITIYRTYDSRIRDKKGDFGYGWNIDLSTVKLEENREMGEGWFQQSSGGLFKTYFLLSEGSHYVTITLPDGRVMEFDCKFLPEVKLIEPIRYIDSAVYTPAPGTYGSLAALDEDPFYFDGSSILNTEGEIYDPDRYELTFPDGTIYVIDQRNGLEKITDMNGNSITFGPDGIIHSAGKSVTFSRDSQDRIISITDPMGKIIEYEYDSNGDLVSVTDQEESITRFTYNLNHGLLDIIDPRGITPARNEYDDDGRLIAHTDAEGNRIEYTHNIGTRQEVITDRLGYITVYDYDEKGNIIQETDPLGNVTQYTYDEHGNKLTQTSIGCSCSSTFTYDEQGNLLSETDPLGNRTEYTYNTHGQILTIRYPGGSIKTNTYDNNGNLLSTKDTMGNMTAYTYDQAGNITSMTDPLNNITTYTYDASGNMISQTDPLGNIIEYTYDSNGNRLSETKTRTTHYGEEMMVIGYVYNRLNQMVQTIDPYGNTITTEYNSIGKKSTTVDKFGNRTEYRYDARANLIRVIHPDGSEESYTYDAENRKESFTNRAGQTTNYTYDALDREIRTTYADGSYTEKVYIDNTENVSRSTDELGNETLYSYDKAGRNISVTDALGNVTLYEYDENGNKILMIDARGNVIQYKYDLNNRLTQTIFPDGTYIEISYDPLGRKISETDQAGNTTQFEYDAMGRLITVTDALGNITSYGYDEVGNRISQTDANGSTTLFEYDNLGRQTRRILTMGMEETFTYDAAGNIISRTDFNGNTILLEYNQNNQLTKRTFPEGTTQTFTYTPTGRRDTVTESRGITSYEYDLRDRLTRRTDPDGRSISYTYDNAGNRTSATIPTGTTNYTFDPLNRLATVIDPEGGITRYVYDAVGNRRSVIYPNGTVTDYTYDTLNRLINLVNRKSGGAVISSYAYTLGPAGNRTQVVEDTNRVVNYTYEATYKLIQEGISDPVSGSRLISYTYDPAGNRLTKTDNGIITTYAYDVNDRLLTENDITYTYDNNGNTLTKSGPTENTSYHYDALNRLIRADITDTSGSTVVEYDYDVDDIRIQKRLDSKDIINYMVDKNLPFEQVLLETDAEGSVISSYVYGEDLISQKRAGTTSYYHYDGQLSTRQLTDPSETVTDTYTYDAFGRVLSSSGGTANNYLYTGEQFDMNIGFYYLRARYEDPDTGRFLTQDKFPGSIFEPISLHRYLYANADPVNNLDPSGESPLVSVTVSMAINLNIRSIYIKQLVLAFVDICVIAYCVIEPAASNRKFAMWAIMNGAGAWAYSLERESRVIMAAGFTQIAERIKQAYRKMQNEIISFKIGIGGELGYLINVYSGRRLMKKVEKLKRFKKEVEDWADLAYIYFTDPIDNCDWAERMQKMVYKVIELAEAGGILD